MRRTSENLGESHFNMIFLQNWKKYGCSLEYTSILSWNTFYGQKSHGKVLRRLRYSL